VGLSPDAGAVLYLHGGGYVVCSPGTHRALVAWLCAQTGATIYALDYRLAPEHPYPAALEDALASLRELHGRINEREKLVIAGDSAGGGLALSVLSKAREMDLPRPDGALLISPWVDLACRGETLKARPKIDYLNRDALERFSAHYVGDANPLDPLISPVETSFVDFPPLMVITGEKEVFVAENHLLVKRAKAAGVDVEHVVEPGQVHAFPAFGPMSPGTREVIKKSGAFLRRRLGRPTPEEEDGVFCSA
jgi:acetyl esterase/lipase